MGGGGSQTINQTFNLSAVNKSIFEQITKNTAESAASQANVQSLEIVMRNVRGCTARFGQKIDAKTQSASTLTAISAGDYHTCVLLDNASVKCWRYNSYGQFGIEEIITMGDGSGEMTTLPSINLGTGRAATAISAGDYHTCALLNNASVKCWGGNNYGQLGIENINQMGDGSGKMDVILSIDL